MAFQSYTQHRKKSKGRKMRSTKVGPSIHIYFLRGKRGEENGNKRGSYPGSLLSEGKRGGAYALTKTSLFSRRKKERKKKKRVFQIFLSFS